MRLRFTREGRLRLSGVGLILATLLAGSASAQTAVGWRGDGTGRFPDVDAPVTWGRVSAAVKGLRFQARKPKSAEPDGKPMPDGVIREWLVLGPVPVPDVPKAVESDTLPNELQLEPDEGEKIGALAWKSATADSGTLNFTAQIGRGTQAFAYAHTYVYADADGEFTLPLTHRSGARLVVNGKPAYAGTVTGGTRVGVKFLKGWNRVLLKVSSDDAQWFAVPLLHAHTPRGYDETNIAWMTPLPGAHVYQATPASPGGPIVVDDRIFVLCEPHDLFCLNKADGKVLWVRSNSYFDALTDAERNANPAFKEVEPLAAKWSGMNAEYVAGGAAKTTLEEHEKLEKALYDALKAIDRKRFARPGSQDVGYAGLTPTSDGKFVYAWFASGVTACYDRNGNRQWIRIDNHQTVEHGFSSSPTLAGDNLVVFMRELMGFDAKTGRDAWRIPLVEPTGLNPANYFHGSCVHARLGGVDIVILPSGGIVRASDGKILFTDPRIVSKQQVASPVLDHDLLCVMTSLGETLFIFRLPPTADEPVKPTLLTELKITTTQFPYFYLGWHIASPLVHDGLIYLMNNSGVLTVVDEKAGSIVYQKMLDLDHFESPNEGAARGHGISPVLAGKHLYFFGNSGATVVLEPGRQFKQVAKNKIEGLAMAGTWGERQDRAVACPVFDGKRLYYRTESGLYAIEAK